MENNLTIKADDSFRSSTVGSLYGIVVISDSDQITSKYPDQLEKLGEACLEAARDLRIAQVNSLGNLVNGDDTSRMMAEVQRRRAMREETQRRSA